MLSVVLPKGSLENQVLELFDAADLTVIRGGERDYNARIDDPRIDRVRFLRPQEIPTYVEQGIFDLGISGRDWVTETGADVVSLGEIGGGRAGESVVKVVLAVPRDAPWESAADLPAGVRISTEMPETTRRFFAERGIEAKVFTSHGATEAKIPDIVDAIVDLTETGSSLRKAGLKIIETLLTSRTELLANRQSYDDPEKRAAFDDIALLLHGALVARGRVLLKLNVSLDQLESVVAALPAMTSPTVMPLADAHLRAVETVVPKRGINTLIPALKAAGARDILELPITKIVEQLRLPGVTPSEPTDVGEPEPALAAALAAGDADVVCALLPAARLLVPVVAMPTGSADVGGEAGGEAEMAVAVLVNESGQRGLPVFTCVAALQEWRRDARPVPMTGSRVMAAAVSEGYDGVVIDVAGPVTFTLKPDDLRRLLA